MKVRAMMMVLSFAALQWVGALHSQNGPPSKANVIDEQRRSAIEAQQQLANQFAEFQKNLQLLRNRLDRSPNPEDKERAAELQEVLDKADSDDIRNRFKNLQLHLAKKDFGLDQYEEAAKQTEALAKDLAKLVELFDQRNNNLSKKILSLKEAIAKIDELIQKEKLAKLITEREKTSPEETADLQKIIIKETKDLKDNLDPNSKKPKNEPKDPKSEAKEGKGDPNKAEPRDDGKPKESEPKEAPKNDPMDKEAKPAEAKPTPKQPADMTDPQKPKTGDKKDPMGGDKQPMAKDAKPPKSSEADNKEAKTKEGQEKEAKPAQPKEANKDGKDPMPKETGEAKGPEKKEQPKNADNKPPTSEPKAKEDKGPDKNPTAKDTPKDSKSPDAKSDAKQPKEAKPAEAKQSDPKQAPKSSDAKPSPPKEGGDQPPPQAKDDNAKPPPPKVGEEKEPPFGKKQIQDIEYAIQKMKDAQKKIEDKKNPDAVPDQDDAIDALNKAKKELEKRLKILREEELERLLANLKVRCERMLAMQMEVLDNGVDGTVQTYRAIQSNVDRKPADKDIQAAFRLAERETEIIEEANKALKILESEGSAVAFPINLELVRDDMKLVHRLLAPPAGQAIDVGEFTQGVEQDIIDALKGMIKALDKKIEEKKNKNDKKKPKEKDPEEQGPPPDQKLLDYIAELKIILDMQKRVNKRTTDFARRYPGQEQPVDPNVRNDIDALRIYQDRIADITIKLQRGENK